MPPKVQFDQLAVTWAKDEEDAGSVTDQILKQTYRLGFDHCVANSCKRNCIGNPRCLSALGGTALSNYLPNKLDENAAARNCDIRNLSEPAGLKNLGATCYLNSLLQVWFHNAKFRDVILRWNRVLDSGEQNSSVFELPETIVGHLQLIFLRLLKSIRRSVDPTALVEVLGLDAEYQQDASECCGLLFNVILDQLRMYRDGALAQELADVYRGKQATVIQCESCGAVRRCPQDFYNMILNVQGHRDVRQCIKALGQRRKIEGDFTCGTCASKKGAVTFEEFTELPPSLNLQLMRYRYDAKSGTKKKVQTPLRFPEVLDLAPYLKECRGEKLYELRAVLVHVGHSANSGHYIANVRRGSDGLWFRLNDENVSAMKGRPDLSTEATELSEKKNGAPPRKNGCDNGKLADDEENEARQVIKDEDEERTDPESAENHLKLQSPNPHANGVDASSEVDSNATKLLDGERALKNKRSKQQRNPIEKSSNDEHTFTSTGAYMLVYERVETKAEEREAPEGGESSKVILHDYLERIVEQEHNENTRMAETIETIRNTSTARAQQLLSDFRDIFSELPYKKDEEYRFVMTTNLSKVIKRTERLFRSICNAIEQPMITDSISKTDAAARPEDETSSMSFECVHGKLSPESSSLSKLKVISSRAASLLDEFCVCYDLSDAWKPETEVPQNFCRDCVSLLGVRVARLSQLTADHKAFSAFLKNKECEEAFWVNNKSLQNWFKLAENQILASTGSKQAKPVEVPFNQRLRCEHGNLSICDKRTVSKEAWEILRKWFPSCVAYPTSATECENCVNESNKERAIASQRANEMLTLRHSLKGLTKFRQNISQAETEAYAIHLDQAVKIRKYLRALTRPSEAPTNSSNSLICSHGKSLVFEKDGTFSENYVLLTLEESNVLRTTFSLDSFVKIQKGDVGFVISPDPCGDCLQLRILEGQRAQSDFVNIQVPVVKLALEELLQRHGTFQNRDDVFPPDNPEPESGTEDEPNSKRPRLGRRIPNAKSILLSSNDTFVDLKVKIMAKHHITPILQVILNGDKLLADIDGEVKIKELGVRANSVLYVAEDVIREDQADAERKKNSKEEIGFGGTKLMG